MEHSDDIPDLETYRDSLTPQLERIDKMARLLDAQFLVPGTTIRFGWDAIIGLIPVVGDTLTLLPQLYFFYVGIRLKVGKRSLLKMLLNIGIDWLVGTIPVLGDLFDVAFKSNLRNAKLLSEAIRRKRADCSA